MRLMRRLSMVSGAKASKALDKAEDFGETLDYSELGCRSHPRRGGGL